jgi:iron complex outermembrane recepter protein
MKSARERLLASTIVGGAAFLALSGPAFAQDTQQPAPPSGPIEATSPNQIESDAEGRDAQDAVEGVVVTGSRIRRPNLVTTSPVTQMTGEDVDVAGTTRVEDLVNELPQAFAAQGSNVSNGATGTATVDLRGLGCDRTLVLIDGKRLPYGSPLDSCADLNQIPAQLIERVEVLTGGASAVYGSDAVAGVVNFIMQRDFEGVQVDAQYSFFQHNNDSDQGNIREVVARRAATNPAQFRVPEDNVSHGWGKELNLIMGVSTPDDRGNITVYAGYRNNDAVLQAHYDYSACSIGVTAASANAGEFTCAGSGTSFPGQFTNFGIGGPAFAFTVGPNRTFVPYNAALNAYNFGPLNYYQRPDERYTFGALGRYEFNERVEAYTQLMFTDYSTIAQIAPSGNFFSTGTINCGNPLLSAQQRTAIGCTAAQIAADATRTLYIGRRNVEGGGRQDDLRYQSYRGVVGLRGALAEGWDYDVAAQYSNVELARVYRNEFETNRLARALDVVDADPGPGVNPQCRSVVNGTDPNCVPYDIFAFGGVTQAALDYVQVPLVLVGNTTQQVVTGAVTGDLGAYGIQSPMAARPISVAFGAEYRRDALESTPDITFQTGAGAGQGGPTLPVAGETEVYELFSEIEIPLFEDRPFADLISVDAAYRFSDYSSGNQTHTYKVGADYAPIEDIRFRGSYSHAVRAPNIIELFTGQGFGLFDMDDDPCGPSRTATLAQCTATGVPPAQYGSPALDSPAGQYNQLTGGNPDLEPEDADTVTFGVVFTPSFIPRFDLTIDYFNIEVEGLIATFGAQNTVNACYQTGDAAACSRINRNPGTGQLWIGAGFVENTNINIGGLRTSGIDINANYQIDLDRFGLAGMGGLTFNYIGTILNELITDPGPGIPGGEYDCVGFFGNQCGTPNPEYRHRFRTTWATPWNVDLTGTWRYFGEVELFALGGIPAPANRPDRYFDAENYFDIAATWQMRDNLRLRAGVNNVLDNDPPISASVGAGFGNGNTYPQVYDALGRYIFVGLTADF